MAGLQVLLGCVFIIHIVLGSVVVSGALSSGSSSGHGPPAEFGWLFIFVGGCAMLLIWAMAVAHFLAARWMGERRNWTFSFVVACISCLSFPMGTALGVFTIIVLNRPSVKALYAQQQPGGYLNS